jgi:phage shock protein E
MSGTRSKNPFSERLLLVFAAFLLLGLIYIAFVAMRGPVGGVDSQPVAVTRADPGVTVLIDARSPGEYAATHIPGAINVPFDAVEANLALLPVDKEKPVAVHCRTGHRAGLLKEQLDGMGYTDVRVVPNEQIEWGDDGPVAWNPDAKP